MKKSKMNADANFWAESVIGDFENNLLNALERKLRDKLSFEIKLPRILSWRIGNS